MESGVLVADLHGVCRAVAEIQLAVLHGQDHGIVIGEGEQVCFVQLYVAAPVILIGLQDHLCLLGEFGDHEGTGAVGFLGIVLILPHVVHAHQGIAEVVQEAGIRLRGHDGQFLTVGLHALDLQGGLPALILLQGALEAVHHGLGGHLLSVGEVDVVPQGEDPGDTVFRFLHVFHQDGHRVVGVVQLEQGLRHAGEGQEPSVPVHGGVQVRGAEHAGGGTCVQYFLVRGIRCRGIRALRRSAGYEGKDHNQSENDGNPRLSHCFSPCCQ